MTKIDTNGKFCAPFQRYSKDSSVTTIQFIDKKHTPYNKRAGAVDSLLRFAANRNFNSDHIELLMEEITTTKNYGDKPARTAGRIISTDIAIDEAEKLANFILEAVAARRAAITNPGE